MTAFRYVAYTQEGKRRKGVLVADSRAQATEQLRSKGLFSTELEERKASTGWSGLRKRSTLSRDERAVLTRQLEVLLSADIALDVALETVGSSGGSVQIEAVAVSTRAALREGETLSDALTSSGAGFPPYVLAAIAAGESSGDLARVVGELASHLETLTGDQSRLTTALIYPAFVAAVSLLVCGILVTSVAPQIVSMFEATGRPLPAITQTLLRVTGWLEQNWMICLAATLALIGGLKMALRRPRLRARWEDMLLRLPVAGRLIRLSAAQQYLQTLALVISSRQTATVAVENAARVLQQHRFQQEANAVTDAIHRGQSLSAALRHLSMIPPVCRQLITVGEQSAGVGLMAERSARLVGSWLENDRKRLAALIDPLLMMVVGGFVLVVVLAILLPIFDLQAMVAPG